ncbi:hypothetical protein [Aquimarina algiphila]|uniref:Uncharacterized protein n=1 Tax=Aquimarina algiphila TaxID=2047982 RepID=A0A554VHG8_9FLAO|nr:hypothetical protein [Aquimarina algiphila]TSE06970.1 hypothetical protein FOF46_17250 [Aquimarina algiphila]
MRNKISTDLIPYKNDIPHSKDNWPSPEADLMCIAKEFLDNLDHHGFLDLYFDSEEQVFIVYDKTSEELLQEDITEIMRKLNEHIEDLKV